MGYYIYLIIVSLAFYFLGYIKGWTSEPSIKDWIESGEIRCTDPGTKLERCWIPKEVIE